MPAESVPHAVLKPRLDASADDPAWKTAALIPALSLSTGPDAKGLKPSLTKIQLLWDEKYLYVRFICRDDSIESPFQGRDQPLYKGDAVEVFLDVVGDSRKYIELQVSPKNQIFDQKISLDAAPVSNPAGRLTDEFTAHHFQANPAWNMEGLRIAAARIPGGWIAELAIPSIPLGVEKWHPMSLRAHLMRYDWLQPAAGPRRLVAMNWAPVVYGCPHISPEAMGILKLLPEK